MEIHLLMKRYFSYTEIQNMSYFDFKLYVEALSNKEAEQIKQEEEASAKIREGII